MSRRRSAAIKARYGIASAKLFGSAVREDFGPASDVDVAVRFSRQPKLQDLLDLELELEAVFDRDVDVVINVLREDLPKLIEQLRHIRIASC